MTTDPAPVDGRSARPAAPDRRRAARPATSADPAEPAAAPAPGRRARRRHAAAGGRIVAGSLSAALTFALMGAMARSKPPGLDTSPSAAPAAPAPPTVIVIRRTAGAAVVPAPAPPRVAPTVSRPVASSRGS